MSESIAYKILTRDEHDALRRDGYFLGTPNDRESGFIHLSGRRQVAKTAEKHYSKADEVVIVAIDLEHVKEYIKWEYSSNGQTYPHLYGPLTVDSIVREDTLHRGHDGLLSLEYYELP